MLKILKIISIVGLWISIALVNGSCCKNTEPYPLENDVVLNEATRIGGHTATELKALIAVSGYSFPFDVKNDVDIYQITYKTTYNGDPMFASGLVILPLAQDVGMITINHGTIIKNDEAPSSVTATSLDALLYSLAGAMGYIVVIPDYIGFGRSSHILHPYYVEDLYGSSITDMLLAAKELATNQKIQFNQKLFLTGYSEGGYATMACHKFIEEKGLPGFNLQASFPAAGGYDVKGVQEYLFSLNSYAEPFYIGYVAMSYKTTFNWEQPLTDLFNEPYASELPNLFDRMHSSGDINNALTDSIPLLLNKDLRDSIETSARFKYFKDAIHANSLTDWKPTIRMFMYHGDADTTVPYQNSVDTYNTLIANGASTDILKFITLPGADHGSGVQPYIEDVLPKIVAISSGAM